MRAVNHSQKSYIKYFKVGIVAILIFVSILSWWRASRDFAENKEEIIIQLADIAKELALPYRIARLSLLEPDEELLMPVYGILVRDISDTWGEARSEGRTHEGVDIFAPRGTPVYAAAPGYVTRVSEGSRGGLFVFTVGAGGRRYYYAHLSRVALGIEEGEEVTTDTVLGFVGNTGNASGTPPHLHFGMYSRGAQNPFSLIVDR